MRPTDKLEELYIGEKKQLLLEEETVEMVEDPLPLSEIGIHTAFGKIAVTLSQGEAAVAMTVLMGAISLAAAKFVVNYIDEHGKRCRHLKIRTPQWRYCMLSTEIKARSEVVKRLKASVPACKYSKKPEKCESKIGQKVAKEEDKIRKLKFKVSGLPKP